MSNFTDTRLYSFVNTSNRISGYLDAIRDCINKGDRCEAHAIELRTHISFTERNQALRQFTDKILDSVFEILALRDIEHPFHFQIMDSILYECSNTMSPNTRDRRMELCQIMSNCLSQYSSEDITIRFAMKTIAPLYNFVSNHDNPHHDSQPDPSQNVSNDE